MSCISQQIKVILEKSYPPIFYYGPVNIDIDPGKPRKNISEFRLPPDASPPIERVKPPPDYLQTALQPDHRSRYQTRAVLLSTIEILANFQIEARPPCAERNTEKTV